MGEIIAARSMNTLYIIVDVVILTLLAILLLIKKRRLTFLFGVAGVSMEVSADEILTQTVKSANRQNGVWYLLTESPEQTQSPPEMEVNMC